MISKLYKTDKWLVLVAIFGSLALSLWANIADDVVNNDGIEYLKSARAILDGEWAVAVHTYKWPFYSGIIALTSSISGLSLTISAYVVNALCYVWLVLAFIALVRLMGGTRSALWFAVFIILAFPVVNKFRPYLIRDPAFLALFLSGCYAFFLYIKAGATRHNIIAIACFSISVLFRLEGLVYLFATQGYLLARRLVGQGRRWLGVLALIVLLILLIVFATWWQFSPTESMGYTSVFTQPLEFMQAAWQQVIEEMSYRLEVIEAHILVGYSRSYSSVVLFWSAASIVLLKLMHALHYLYFILVYVAWRKGLLFPEKTLYKPWRFIILVALLILLSFVLAEWFLVGRYPITVALLLLMACPFLLDSWYADIQAGQARRWFWPVIVLITLTGLSSLDLNTHKRYLKATANWMQQNIPQNASVYTNNRILAHYFGRSSKVDPYWPTWESFMTGSVMARQYLDYGAIEIKHRDTDYVKNIPILLERKLMAEFVNDKGSRVMIFDFSKLPETQKPAAKYIE